MERASKISHGNVIANPMVQAFLDSCTIPRQAEHAVLDSMLVDVPDLTQQHIRAVVAVDGSMRETPVQTQFPSASVTFFTFGPLLFHLDALRELDREPFIAPEDLVRLKNIQRYSLVLPTRNVSRNGMSLRDSVRRTLHEFFVTSHAGDEPLATTLRWVIFREWTHGGEKSWAIERCPNPGCDNSPILLTPATRNEFPCGRCGQTIYLIDVFRLHERIDEEMGAAGISSYVLTLLEQIVLAHIIRAVWQMKPVMLRELLLIKDGPLAFFGQTAPLSKPFRELASFLGDQPDPADNSRRLSLLNVVGLEKSGAFVEHASVMDSHIREGSVLPLTNDYIYRYIVPGDPNSPDPYGKNTYWGSKLIFKAKDGNTYVATIPTKGGFTPTPRLTDYLNVTSVLHAVAELRCSMYDNALIPVALANRLISLSEVPSSRILETFARDRMKSRD
jgi:NurA domain.